MRNACRPKDDPPTDPQAQRAPSTPLHARDHAHAPRCVHPQGLARAHASLKDPTRVAPQLLLCLLKVRLRVIQNLQMVSAEDEINQMDKGLVRTSELVYKCSATCARQQGRCNHLDLSGAGWSQASRARRRAGRFWGGYALRAGGRLMGATTTRQQARAGCYGQHCDTLPGICVTPDAAPGVDPSA
jgi:hypothetical protein